MLKLWSAAVVAVALVSPASAGPLEGNPWLERPFLNFAHQGGEIEAPSNTLYAYKRAVALGADVIELDVHASADGEIVAIHDATVNRTTDGSGRVDSLTLAQLKALDAAHWFVPGVGTTHSASAGDYSLRGMATGDRDPLPGYEPNDFTIPSLGEVLAAFPDVLINIEIKNTLPDTAPYEHTLAALLHRFGRTDDTIVVSFRDDATDRFKLFAPEVTTAVGLAEAAAFYATAAGPAPGAPHPLHDAIQVPITFEGIQVISQDFVDNAHANGFAVHVWTINTRAEMEHLLDLGVDGIMTDVPSLLERVLSERAS